MIRLLFLLSRPFYGRVLTNTVTNGAFFYEANRGRMKATPYRMIPPRLKREMNRRERNRRRWAERFFRGFSRNEKERMDIEKRSQAIDGGFRPEFS